MSPGANADAIEAWSTVLFEKFSRFRHLVTVGLGAHGSAAIDRLAPRQGSRVIDLGCGFGDTTIDLANRVGAGGEVVGVDAAPGFIDVAQEDARRGRIGNARFMVADVEADALGGPYDLAFSRFGTMFFASPVRALRNVRAALVPGGRLTMVVWRRREDNPWLHEAEKRVRGLVPEPEKKAEPTCGPGPFSMAGADLVSDVLLAAGYERITLERFEADICIGRDADEALEFAMALGPAGEVLRLAGDEAERLRPRVREALREAFAPFTRPDGMYARSSSWIVSAFVP